MRPNLTMNSTILEAYRYMQTFKTNWTLSTQKNYYRTVHSFEKLMSQSTTPKIGNINFAIKRMGK